jgi:hypothetical protein
MLRLRRKSLWFGLILALLVLPTYRPGPFPEDKKADAKKPAKLDVNAVPENARRVAFTTDEGTWMGRIRSRSRATRGPCRSIA